MTTAFELASSIDSYQAFGISRIVDPYSVYNSLSRVPAVPVPSGTAAVVTRTDTADFSGTSSLVAAALTDSGLRAERLASLRDSIANGTYRVPAATTAESLFSATIDGL